MALMTNKKFLIGFPFIVLLLIFSMPVLSQAAGLVPCGSLGEPVCDFNFFVLMINNIINWIISIAGVIFAISLIYGGYIYLTSAGDTGKQGKAKEVLSNTLYGFVIILVSWLIIYTILNVLVPTGSSIFKFIGTR